MKHRRTSRRISLRIEPLESRQLLATGDLDVTFSGDGQVTTSVENPYNQADVAIQRDGKIVLLGSLNVEDGQDQFLLTRYNRDGTLDSTFSGDGMLTARFANARAVGTSLALQEDGKILVSGNSGSGFGVARFLSNGALDTTFGGDGRVVTSLGVVTEASSLVLQSDGKIVVAGVVHYSGAEDSQFVMARYNVDGQLDTTFNGDGKLFTLFERPVSHPHLAIQADDKVVATAKGGSSVGAVVVRYESDGSLDETFGEGGKAAIPAISLNEGIVIQSIGRIVVGGSIPVRDAFGSTQHEWGLIGLKPDGDIDTSFGEDGRVATLLGDYQGIVRDLAVKPDDSIVAVGDASAPTRPRQFVVAAYQSDGSPDRSFSGDGSVMPRIHEYGWSVAVQTDGKYVMAGWDSRGVIVARFLTNVQPEVSLRGSLTYTEAEPAQVLAEGATVRDADDLVLTGGNLNVAITANAASGDRLWIRNQGTGAGQISITTERFVYYEGTVIGRYTAGNAAQSLVVTLNANATVAAVQALVRAVTFKNIDANPPAGLRSLRFLLNDGDGGISRPQFKYVNVQRLSDSPRITMGGEVSYVEDAPPAVVSAFAGLENAAGLNFDGGKLTVAITQNATSADRLSLRHQGTGAGQIGVAGSDVTFGGTTIGTLSGGAGSTPLEVSLNANATPAAVLALIRNVTFATLGDNPSTAQRMLSFVLDDGDGNVSPAVFKPAAVSAVNDAVVLTADPGPVDYVNNDPAGVLLAAAATIADPDNSNFYRGKLTATAVAGAAAVNRLEIGGAFTVSGAKVLLGSTIVGWIHSNGIGLNSLDITFTDQATPSIVQQLVRSLRFRTVDAANTFDRTIEITLLDSASSIGSTAEVEVAVRES